MSHDYFWPTANWLLAEVMNYIWYHCHSFKNSKKWTASGDNQEPSSHHHTISPEYLMLSKWVSCPKEKVQALAKASAIANSSKAKALAAPLKNTGSNNKLIKSRHMEQQDTHTGDTDMSIVKALPMKPSKMLKKCAWAESNSGDLMADKPVQWERHSSMKQSKNAERTATSEEGEESLDTKLHKCLKGFY